MADVDAYSDARMDLAITLIEGMCFEIAEGWATDVQAQMRSAAPWTDRNGPSLTGLNARQSLKAEAGRDEASGDIVIVASTDRMTLRPWREFPGAPVGLFLERGTRFMAPRPVIQLTVEQMAPILMSRLATALTMLEGGTA